MKKALVLGKGKSGQSAKSFLENIGYSAQVLSTEELGKYKAKNLSLICISPGISKNDESVKRLESEKVNVCGELELGFKFTAGDIVAITGTNGKTTTTTLIGNICKLARNTFVGGNIGVPITSFAKKTKISDVIVLEVSSFQAETFNVFKPKIGVFLNFADDHLDRHLTREEYFNAKCKLFQNQGMDDYVVVNFDDSYLRSNIKDIKSQVYYFSLNEQVIGCYLKNCNIYFNDGISKDKVCKLPKHISERHNVQNVLAAVCATKLLGIPNCCIKEAIEKFETTVNRIEFVDNINSVKFINDSKSTNVASTLAALKAIKGKVVLIVGGKRKGCTYDELFTFDFRQVKALVVIGETADEIETAAKKAGYNNYIKAETFEKAVKLSFKIAESGECVLLSPACASFDMFNNYEHRGEEFKRIVKELKDENSKDAGVKKT